MSSSDPHRAWRTPLGVAGNCVVAVVVLLLGFTSAFNGQSFYGALAVVVVAAFGALPAYRAWKDGALLKGRRRSNHD